MGHPKSPRAATPKPKSKAQLEREKLVQETIMALAKGGMDETVMNNIIAKENVAATATKKNSKETEEVDDKDDKKDKEEDWAKTFSETVMSWTKDLNQPFHVCVLVGMIYVLYGNPDGAWLTMFCFLFVAGFTIYYNFDKKHKLRNTMVVFSGILMFSALYGISTQQHFKSEESLMQRLRDEDAAKTLEICNKAIKAQLKTLNDAKIKKTVQGFSGFLF